MKRKILALLLGLVLVFSISGTAFATPGVDEPGVSGIYIDPIADITLNPAELIDMQNNGLIIPVTGYVQYLSALNPAGNPTNPKLTQLYLNAYRYNGASWDLVAALINYPSGSTALASTGIRSGMTGREFTDAAFSKADLEIYETGLHRVIATAYFTAGTLPTDDTEDFTVTVVATITVYPMAAPNIAGIILEAEGVNPNQSTGKGKNRTFINLIAETAHHMGPQTLFNGIEKSVIENDIEVCNSEYWDEVLAFLNGYGYSFTYTLDDYIADLELGP